MTGQNQGSAAAQAITFAITSCVRFDLLAETLTSFLTHNAAPITRYVLIEDSGDDRVVDLLAQFDVAIDVLINDPPLGQIASIDRIYATLDTPFIFHCEDDWRFFRLGFIEDSLVLLTQDPMITAVLCRRPGQNRVHDRIYDCPLLTCGGVAYRKAMPWLDTDWLGYSFNPGLRRLSDYRLLGSFGRWGHELDVSCFFKKRGMMVATLEVSTCETTGNERRLPKHWAGRLIRRQWLRLATLGRNAFGQNFKPIGQAARRFLNRRP